VAASTSQLTHAPCTYPDAHTTHPLTAPITTHINTPRRTRTHTHMRARTRMHALLAPADEPFLPERGQQQRALVRVGCRGPLLPHLQAQLVPCAALKEAGAEVPRNLVEYTRTRPFRYLVECTRTQPLSTLHPTRAQGLLLSPLRLIVAHLAPHPCSSTQTRAPDAGAHIGGRHGRNPTQVQNINESINPMS